jgi:hypothetical protein
MFALFSTRLRSLLFFMIAVPIGGRLLEAVGRRLERTAGPTSASRALRSAGRTAGRFSRGPLRSRYAPDAEQAGDSGPAQPTTAPGSGVNGQAGGRSRRRSRH